MEHSKCFVNGLSEAIDVIQRNEHTWVEVSDGSNFIIILISIFSIF